MLTPGHVAIFGGWKNKARGEYIAIEQTTWGDHARRHVRRIRGRAVALRRRGIADRKLTAAARVPDPARTAAVAKTASTASAAIADAPATEISTTFTVASIAAAIEPETPARPLVSLVSLESFATAMAPA